MQDLHPIRMQAAIKTKVKDQDQQDDRGAPKILAAKIMAVIRPNIKVIKQQITCGFYMN